MVGLEYYQSSSNTSEYTV